MVNFRGIALAADGVWASGFCKSSNSLPTHFGTNQVYSSLEVLPGYPFGIMVWHNSGCWPKSRMGPWPRR